MFESFAQKHEKWISGLLVLVFVFIVLFLIQFSTSNLVGNDGYYHIKMAELMRGDGLKETVRKSV